MRALRSALLVLTLPVALGAQTKAQSDRYELGRRLRCFEVAWNRIGPDAKCKQRVLPHLQTAVSAFFTLRTSEVCRALAEAEHALTAEGALPPEVLWAKSLVVAPACALLDVRSEKIAVLVRSAFAFEGECPAKARIVVELREDDSNEPVAFLEHVPTGSDTRIELPLTGKSVHAAEHWLDARVFVGDAVLARSTARVSIASDLEARIAAVAAAVAEAESKDTVPTTDGETLKLLARMLAAMAKGRVQETDFAALALLADAERIVECVRKGEAWFTDRLRGDHLVQLRYGNRTLPIRCFVPEKLATPAPLVIAFHGAGGSENMFFDAYGAGEIVRRCRALGWVLVTPRGGMAEPAAGVAELARCLPIDQKRVFLVGHSMGAANAAAAAPDIPDLAGVALLGGGGMIRGRWSAIPTFLGAGSADFGLSGVRNSQRALERQKLERLVFREYPEVEHLAVVAVALPEVFDFFLAKH